jgi:hypothetical protein
MTQIFIIFQLIQYYINILRNDDAQHYCNIPRKVPTGVTAKIGKFIKITNGYPVMTVRHD